MLCANEKLIGVRELADILNISASSLYNRLENRPWTLPPTCTPPNTKPICWQLNSVRVWLENQTKIQAERNAELARRAGVLLSFEDVPRAPGRPRKSEQIARRRNGGR